MWEEGCTYPFLAFFQYWRGFYKTLCPGEKNGPTFPEKTESVTINSATTTLRAIYLFGFDGCCLLTSNRCGLYSLAKSPGV